VPTSERKLRTISRVLRLPVARPVAGQIALRIAKSLASSNTPRPVVGRLRDGVLLHLDLSEHHQAGAFLYGEYEPHVLSAILEHLPESGGTFVDVGANVGLIALPVSAARPDVQVHAVEAHPGNADALRRSVELNDANVTVHETAISDQPGVVHLDVSEEAARFHITSDDSGIAVPASTLDALASQANLEHIDVLKLDIEGAEVAALTGAASLLERGAIACVVCEVIDAHLQRAGASSGELDQILRRHGFTRRQLLRERPWRHPAVTPEAIYLK
jgi:FkbM family methyltransferase